VAKYGSDLLGWNGDPREAAFAAMGRMTRERLLLEVVIMRWDDKEGESERKVAAFRLERLRD
jgi:hypothetical protein